MNELSLAASKLSWLVPLFTLTLAFPAVSANSSSPDHWEVEGVHGELQVHGTLTEGACRLDMLSAYQDIDLGLTPLSSLERVGDMGEPVTFTLRLRDCIREGGNQRDFQTSGLTWDSVQPVVTVRFESLSDPDSPQLVKANGISGMGLRLADVQGRDIRLGERGTPLFVTPGSDELIYSVRPERTSAPLKPGQYRAVVNFSLDYY